MGKTLAPLHAAIAAFPESEEQASLSQMSLSQAFGELAAGRVQQKSARTALADSDAAHRAAASNKFSSKNVALAAGSASGPAGMAMALAQKGRADQTAANVAARAKRKNMRTGTPPSSPPRPQGLPSPSWR